MPATETIPRGADPAAIRRRRRVLYLVAAAALLIVLAFALAQVLKGDKKSTAKPTPKPPVILERIELKPVGGSSARGLAELVRHPTYSGLRVVAVKLAPTEGDEVYQLLLAGGRSQPKLLGNEKVGDAKTFVGEARVSSEELHGFRRIELRRVGQGTPPPTKLILRGSIPR